MAANTLTFDQASVVLNSMYESITGQAAPANLNTANFITVANTLLQSGFDQIMNSINQMYGRTIFSSRRYDGRFMTLQRSEQEWGNAVRKINYGDLPAVDDDQWNITDGETLDMYKVRLPRILQTNFYGGNAYSDYETFYREQLHQAFRSADELSRYISGRLVNIANRHTQWDEAFREAAIANLAGGIITENKATRVYHLLSEYNAETGSDYTATTIKAPETYKSFLQWLSARLNMISTMMATRGALFSTQVTGKEVMRHTPKSEQHFYILSEIMYGIEASSYANTYNDSWIKIAQHEAVPYWQNAQDTKSLKVTPSYMGTDGAVKTASAPVDTNALIGVIVDKDAVGSTTINQWSDTTPFNSRGGYYNIWWHWTNRYWNDFTENAVVLMLD